jgi:hypothetical protein
LSALPVLLRHRYSRPSSPWFSIKILNSHLPININFTLFFHCFSLLISIPLFPSPSVHIYYIKFYLPALHVGL